MNGVTPPGASRKGGEGEDCVLHSLSPGKMDSESKEILNNENGLSVQQGKLWILSFATFFVFLRLFVVKGGNVSGAVSGWALCGAGKASEVESWWRAQLKGIWFQSLDFFFFLMDLFFLFF